jgi:MFS family permease
LEEDILAAPPACALSATESRTVALALNLVPFAGVAFLWFIGVLRDRLGQQEDRFFATVFFGSALLFLATLFAAAAVCTENLIRVDDVMESPKLAE